MYDRKTWIVVIACSILLAVNIYYQNKNRTFLEQQELKNKQAVEEAQKASAPQGGTTTPGAPATNGEKPPAQGGLEQVEPPVQVVEQNYTLETSETKFVFTNVGGGLRYAELKNKTLGAEGPVQLNRHGLHAVGAIADAPDRPESTMYEYVADASVPGKSVSFRGKLPGGVWAQKTWTLRETGNEGDPYMLDFKLQLQNDGPAPINLEMYSVFLGTATPLDYVERPDQTGAVMNDGGSFTFLSSTGGFSQGWFFNKTALTQVTRSLEKTVWAGVSNQFFSSVLRPLDPKEQGSFVWATVRNQKLVDNGKDLKAVSAGLRLPTGTLAPKEGPRTFSYELFTGPKQNRILRKMEDKFHGEWGALMNYTPGFVSPFSRFLNFSLWWVHNAVSRVSAFSKWSWGIAVIVLTLLLRTAIWPLYNRSNRTMKRMAKLKPEMDKLREKYPDDPQKMNQEMMGLYKKYGINPLGGCLPMFAQLPIFFGFYTMLLHAVEMRGQGFMWVTDLSQPDTVWHLWGLPINPLPILMAITSFAQMAMMPNTGGDKSQMMIMRFMPFMFLFMCYNFASALALYWTTSNLFSIIQTVITNKLPEPQLKAKAGGGGKGGPTLMERLQAKAEEAQRMQQMRQAKGREVNPEDTEPPKKRPPRTGG